MWTMSALRRKTSGTVSDEMRVSRVSREEGGLPFRHRAAQLGIETGEHRVETLLGIVVQLVADAAERGVGCPEGQPLNVVGTDIADSEALRRVPIGTETVQRQGVYADRRLQVVQRADQLDHGRMSSTVSPGEPTSRP
ncbi:hypothetical protein [Sinorhizobium psoraleae]|uniref:Uncharacterized protein n=1 Tax=Sinorhizobium psoraleae TaxID=520838 RepID=A0ABT4KNC2_9HYPH|nr:hypothetical protein [Sinorhizobium psoraleae]MCZ4093469.1 hypothetical protein [Sinorhizobium psoraleae]